MPPDSPEPGPWRTDRVPFWRAIYAAFADADHDTIVVVCGAQMSKTEGIFNVIGHRFTDGPFVPALYVGPTEKQVKSVSKDRIDKMLRSTPILWERTEKGHRYQVAEKWIGGARLGFAWAGSATELSSHPAGLVLVDERDRMDSNTSGEGDPVSLARARLKNFLSRKLGVFSTPTVENASPIWSLWEEGTMQMWAWTCQGCAALFVPRLDLLKWPSGCTPDDALDQATVECPTCQHHHPKEAQPALNATGRYIRHRRLGDNESAPKSVFGKYLPDTDARPRRTASFWISGLASPWASFGQTAKVMIEAYKSGDQERLQAEINTWGGELYRVRGEAPEWEAVSARRLEYPARTVPWGVQKITCGADVQKNGIFYVIRGWGFNSESWLIDDGFIAGETEYDGVWNEFRQILTTPVDGSRIDRLFVDSGYRPGDAYRRPDHAVYTFCRSLPGFAFPTKGMDEMDQPFRYSNIDYSVGGKVIKNGVRLYLLNTGFLKRWVHGRISWPVDQDGGWHLHIGTTENYCKQIVSEEQLLKASGRVTWVRKSRNNHFLDCETNATAAALTLRVDKLERKTAAGSGPTNDAAPSPNPRRSGYERRGL